MRAVLVYTASRLGLFAGVLAVLALLGLTGYPLVLVALAITAPASYFLLHRQRVQMALAVERTIGSVQRRTAERAAAEDAANAATPTDRPRRRITAIR